MMVKINQIPDTFDLTQSLYSDCKQNLSIDNTNLHMNIYNISYYSSEIPLFAQHAEHTNLVVLMLGALEALSLG